MTKVLLVGAGAMGEALHQGWIKASSPFEVTIIDPSRTDYLPSLEALPQGYGPDVIVFAVKPQLLGNVLPPYIRFCNQGCLFISIAAGVSIKTYQDILGLTEQIIRAMPNLPATVGQGMTALFTNSPLTPKHLDLGASIFTGSGSVLWITNESLMDIVTAISGSGPAYFFCMVEALANAGIAGGLSPETAHQLARQTAIGAGAMMAQLPDSAQDLRIRVTSPGGTTAAALSIFEQNNALDQLVLKAVEAATLRGRDLSHV